jgi:hypothetical protein
MAVPGRTTTLRRPPHLGVGGIFTLFEIWVGFVLWSIRFVKFSYSRFTDGCAGALPL